MGRYTPHQTFTNGNEYPGLLEEHIELGLFVERGYQFRVTANEGPLTQAARFYVAELPAATTAGHVPFITVYRRGNEVHTPAKSLLIPCTGASTLTNSAVTSGATVAQALSSPANDDGVEIGTTAALAEVHLHFGTDDTDVAAELTGKRILNVSLLYTLAPSDSALIAGIEDGVTTDVDVGLWRTTDSVERYIATAEQAASPTAQQKVSEIRFGEVNPFWSAAVNPDTGRQRQPWFYTQLDFLRNVGGTVRVQLIANPANYETILGYAALKVTYCDENRIGQAGLEHYYDHPVQYNYGPNLIQYLREAQTLSPGIPLEYGDFTITIKKADAGVYGNIGPSPLIYALRSVEPFASHPGVLIVNELVDGSQPLMETTDLVPQLMLYETASVDEDDPTGVSADIASSFGYGTREAVPVHVSSQASQDLVNSVAVNDTPFGWIRFWARHHNAQGALYVRIGAAGQETVVGVITPEELDALPEVVDGWREVTMRATTDLLVDSGGATLTDAILFTSESGPGWEVLGVADPWATTSLNATYGGSSRRLKINGVEDITADLSAFWAQIPPTVTGLAVAEATQALAAVDPECPGMEPGCLPTGILYHHLTWTVPVQEGHLVNQWGYYELQRQDDTMGADKWETVALLTNHLLDQFDDYEARVGVASRYRIRVVHELGFYGAWSDTTSHTLAEPGVTGGAGPVLIFTSNEDPASNLAYTPVWERGPAETFGFLEAEERTFQRMYGRDYQVAFRPVERGGVEFSRTLLVNAVAVTPETLEAGFRNLRDLAWSDLSYVAVRTDTGDRWLANINVPSGLVQRAAGHLYLATIDVTEVAGEPSPVEVAVCGGLVANGALPGLAYDHRYAAVSTADGSLDTADLDIRVELTPEQWDFDIPLVSRYDESVTTGWLFGIDEFSESLFLFVETPLDIISFSSALLPFGDGERGWVRVVFDADNGAAASAATFYTSSDGVNWTALGATVTDAPLSANGDVDLLVGAGPGGRGSWVPFFVGPGDDSRGGWNGAIHQVELYGDGGVLLADPEFEAQEPGTTLFTDDQGNTWTVTGGGTCGYTP